MQPSVAAAGAQTNAGACSGLVAVGDAAGAVTLVEVSHNLSQQRHGERVAINAAFEREMRREEALEKRAALVARAARAAAAGDATAGGASTNMVHSAVSGAGRGTPTPGTTSAPTPPFFGASSRRLLGGRAGISSTVSGDNIAGMAPAQAGLSLRHIPTLVSGIDAAGAATPMPTQEAVPTAQASTTGAVAELLERLTNEYDALVAGDTTAEEHASSVVSAVAAL